MSSLWPGIDGGYQDPEGYIDLDVYDAAGAIWKFAAGLAVVELKDEEDGRKLLLKAAALVTRRRAKGGEPIRNLKSYLFITYRHLLDKECGRSKPGGACGDRALEFFLAKFGGDAVFSEDFTKSAERRMLVDEIRGRMDDRMREVFDHLLIGYTFEEIGRGMGVPSRGIRKRFHKQLERLARELNGGAEAEGSGSPDETDDAAAQLLTAMR